MADSGKLSLNFVELMKQQPSYGPLVDKHIKYQLTALYNGTYWSLAIKGDQPDLPYVTIELISDDGKTVVRAVRKVDYKEDELKPLKPTNIGTYGPDKTLTELCQVADDTFEEVYNDKWQRYTLHLIKNLRFQAQLPTMKTTYYTIEVVHGSGFQKCYLGTQNNDMRFDPEFPDGNMSVYWNCDPNTKTTSVINAVTERSPIPTYMNLGASISRNPNTPMYRINLSGPAKNFYFRNNKDHYNGYYAIATKDGDGRMAYLKTPDSTVDDKYAIVAVVQIEMEKLFLFRLTPQNPLF